MNYLNDLRGFENMNSDIEISQQTELKTICDVAQNLGILNAIENYGLFKAKIDIAKINTSVLKPLQSADQPNIKKNNSRLSCFPVRINLSSSKVI